VFHCSTDWVYPILNQIPYTHQNLVHREVCKYQRAEVKKKETKIKRKTTSDDRKTVVGYQLSAKVILQLCRQLLKGPAVPIGLDEDQSLLYTNNSFVFKSEFYIIIIIIIIIICKGCTSYPVVSSNIRPSASWPY
jgi:hypothetical protein